MYIKVDSIRVLTDAEGKPLNPRTRYKTDDLDNIATLGQLHPIDVRWCGDAWELLDGHRRLQWHIEHGYEEISAQEVEWQGDPVDYMLATYSRQPLKPTQMGQAILTAKLRGHTSASLSNLLGIKPLDVDTYCALMGLDPVLRGKADAGMLSLAAIRKLVNASEEVRAKVATSDKLVTATTVRAAIQQERGGVSETAYLLEADEDRGAEHLKALRELALTCTPLEAAMWHAQLSTILIILEGKV